jgi:hypothetical protein
MMSVAGLTVLTIGLPALLVLSPWLLNGGLSCLLFGHNDYRVNSMFAAYTRCGCCRRRVHQFSDRG